MKYVVAEREDIEGLDIIDIRDTFFAGKQYHMLHDNGKESYETEEWVIKNIDNICNMGIKDGVLFEKKFINFGMVTFLQNKKIRLACDFYSLLKHNFKVEYKDSVLYVNGKAIRNKYMTKERFGVYDYMDLMEVHNALLDKLFYKTLNKKDYIFQMLSDDRLLDIIGQSYRIGVSVALLKDRMQECGIKVEEVILGNGVSGEIDLKLSK